VVTTCATHGCFGLCLVFLGKALWFENSVIIVILINIQSRICIQVILRHKAQHYHLKCPTWRAGKYLGAMELIRGCGGSDCAQIHADMLTIRRCHADTYMHSWLICVCACFFFSGGPYD
jgi:hypothetical protein